MMFNKTSFKKVLLSASIAVAISGPVFAQDQSISELKEKMSQSQGQAYVTDQDFKKAMEALIKKQAIMEREAKLKELKGESDEDKESKKEKSLSEKLNPPKDAKEVSIEFFDLMEKEYQNNLFELRNEIDALKDRVKELKNPENKEVIQDHIYVTEISAFGNNKYATVMWNFHFFEDVTEGEEVIPGIKISKINTKGVELEKPDGSKHFIYKISKRRALENAYAEKSDPELYYLNTRNEAQSPNDINIRPPMGAGSPQGGFPQGGFGDIPPGAGEPIQVFPQ